MARSRSTAQCIADIKAAAKKAGREISDADLEWMVEALERRRRAARAAGGIASAEEAVLHAADDMARELVAAAAVEKRNRLINRMTDKRLMDISDEAEALFDDPSLGLRATMAGINKTMPGARESVGLRHRSMFQGWMNGFIADLRRDDMLVHFNDGTIDREIARELAELTKPDGRPGISGNDAAQKIAATIEKYRKAALARENRAGAWIRPIPGYIVRQSHDAVKLQKAGFQAWRERILPLLDQERTFADVGDPDAFLRSAYDGLVSGRHLTATGEDEDIVMAFKGPGNLAKRISAHRSLHFRDADAWTDYNAAFGRRSLREALVAEFDRAARNTAIMEAFGTNPRAMFNGVMNRLKDRYRSEKPKYDRLTHESMENLFAEISGETHIAADPSRAAFHAGVRGIQSMAKLGGAVVASVADLATKAATLARYTGDNILAAWGRNLATTLEGFTPGERREIADRIGVGLEGQIGSMAARFSADDSIPGSIARAQRVFFKFNLLTPWTDGNKRGLALAMSRHLGDAANNHWDILDARLRADLEMYGMNDTRWNIARKAAWEAPDGRVYLTPDAVAALPDAALPAGSTARQRARLRDEMSTAIRSFLIDIADEGVPTPGARERAMMIRSTRPDTLSGIAHRYIVQFKAFPVTMMTKQLGRRMEADTAGEFFKALRAGKGDIQGLAHVIVGTTILGYAAGAAKDIAKGRTPRDPADYETWLAAMLQGGGLGLYGDFVFGEFNRFGRSALASAAGPTFSTADDVFELIARWRSGEDAAAQTLRTFISNVPFMNLFYSRAALDWLVLHQLQESLNPGYLRRMERRVERENAQTFILRPSAAIPRGGGNRIFEGVR